MKLPPISTQNELNAETLFRFQVVSQVLVCEATGLSRASAIAEVTSAVQLAINGQWRQVRTRTL